MSTLPSSPEEKVLASARAAQILNLVKENQLVTALCLFILWQTGALLALSSEVSGVIC